MRASVAERKGRTIDGLNQRVNRGEGIHPQSQIRDGRYSPLRVSLCSHD